MVVFFNTTSTWLEMMVRVYGVVMVTGCWGGERRMEEDNVWDDGGLQDNPEEEMREYC